MKGVELLTRTRLFPVRHHSPRASAALLLYLDRVRPKAVLVEGPSDATELIDIIVDKDTAPPIAVLGYRTDGTPGSSLWPFAAYSPEYVALSWAAKNKAKAMFIDMSVGQALAPFEIEGGPPSDAEREGLRGADEIAPDTARASREGAEGSEASANDKGGGGGEGGGRQGGGGGEGGDGEEVKIEVACARSRGLRSFEEFWEASFEAPAYEPDDFRAALIAYAELVRHSGDRAIHRARDAVMARRVLAVIASGYEPEEVAVVIGAAHAAAFAAMDVDLAAADLLPEPVPSASTLIPFSFPRLAEQLGYGAGNRAPQYYQRAHDAGCDFRRATLEVLVEFTDRLRQRGFMASLADTIEAYRLAVTLADIRGKAGPGLDELREATIATMCRGDATHVDAFLWPSVIGKNVGRVASRVGRNSLQEEFSREVKERELPVKDSPEQFRLRLSNEVEVGTSVFLHRLRIAGIPYANFVGTQRSSSRKAQPEPAGGYAALGRSTEVWEARWTPATDIALVEQIVIGNTFEHVAALLLGDQLDSASTTGEVADVLIEAVVTETPTIVDEALAACDCLASTDDDLPSLALACRALSGLVSFGSSRAASRVGDGAIEPLLKKTFDRAILRVAEACSGTDDGVRKPKEALRTLHDIALSQPVVDKTAWIVAAEGLVRSYAVNASASGLACGLLYLAQAIDDAEVMDIVGQRLSNVSEPAAAASFLGGFFEVNALVLVKSRPVAHALDAFLTGIEPARFRDALPVLRRAFSKLGPTERRYLLENVVAARSLTDKSRAAQAILLEKDKEKLREMSSELEKAMDDLDDLL